MNFEWIRDIIDFVFGQSTQDAVKGLVAVSGLTGWIIAFVRGRMYKNKLREEMEAQTRTGDIEMGFTIYDAIEDGSHGPKHYMQRLVTPEHPNLEDLFRNPLMLRAILDAKNDERRGPAHNYEGALVLDQNYGFLRLNDIRLTRGMMLQVRNRYRRIFGLLTTIAGTGVPCRTVKVWAAIRLDDWPTAGMADGFQTYRAIAALATDCEAYAANPDSFRETHFVHPDYLYQDDRFLHLGEMHRLRNSEDKHERAMVIEFEVDIPEIFFQDMGAFNSMLEKFARLGRDLSEAISDWSAKEYERFQQLGLKLGKIEREVEARDPSEAVKALQQQVRALAVRLGEDHAETQREIARLREDRTPEINPSEIGSAVLDHIARRLAQ